MRVRRLQGETLMKSLIKQGNRRNCKQLNDELDTEDNDEDLMIRALKGSSSSEPFEPRRGRQGRDETLQRLVGRGMRRKQKDGFPGDSKPLPLRH